jgi:hypothetical protein
MINQVLLVRTLAALRRPGSSRVMVRDWPTLRRHRTRPFGDAFSWEANGLGVSRFSLRGYEIILMCTGGGPFPRSSRRPLWTSLRR